MMIKLFAIFALLAILLTGCSAASKPTPTQAPASVNSATPTQLPAISANEVKINISGFKFDPASVTISAGTTITWTNQDSTSHTVVGDDDSWTSKDLPNGATFSFTFNKVGTYTYHCGIHPSMKGTIIVQ